MKKKVILFAFIAIAVMAGSLALATANAFPEPKAIPVALFATGPPSYLTQTGTILNTPNLVIDTYKMAIPNCLVIGADPVYVFADSVSTFTSFFYPKTDYLQLFFDGCWQVTGVDASGFRYYPWSFIISDTNYNPIAGVGTYNTVQVIAFGYGSFAGDTLYLHYAGANQLTGTWTGYLVCD